MKKIILLLFFVSSAYCQNIWGEPFADYVTQPELLDLSNNQGARMTGLSNYTSNNYTNLNQKLGAISNYVSNDYTNIIQKLGLKQNRGTDYVLSSTNVVISNYGGTMSTIIGRMSVWGDSTNGVFGMMNLRLSGDNADLDFRVHFTSNVVFYNLNDELFQAEFSMNGNASLAVPTLIYAVPGINELRVFTHASLGGGTYYLKGWFRFDSWPLFAQ